MNKEELKNLRIGDIVIVSGHGNNKGKRGIVNDIVRFGGERGETYLNPLDGEFTFYNQNTRRRNKDGLYGFAHQTIQLYSTKEAPKKEFYITGRFLEKGITWSANSFTSKDLVVLNRFIKELNENALGLEISILDEDDIF